MAMRQEKHKTMQVVELGQFRLAAGALFAAMIPQHGREWPGSVRYVQETLQSATGSRKRHQLGIGGNRFLRANRKSGEKKDDQSSAHFHAQEINPRKGSMSRRRKCFNRGSQFGASQWVISVLTENDGFTIPAEIAQIVPASEGFSICWGRALARRCRLRKRLQPTELNALPSFAREPEGCL